jgi:hypothetical protein
MNIKFIQNISNNSISSSLQSTSLSLLDSTINSNLKMKSREELKQLFSNYNLLKQNYNKTPLDANVINYLAIKYLNKNFNITQKRVDTPPGPLFKRVSSNNHKIVTIRNRNRPPPPPIIRLNHNNKQSTTPTKNKTIFVQGCLPSSEIKRCLLAKLGSDFNKQIILHWNIPNMAFKFRIQV